MRPGSPISGVSRGATSRTRSSVIARSSTGYQRCPCRAPSATTSGRPTTATATATDQPGTQQPGRQPPGVVHVRHEGQSVPVPPRPVGDGLAVAVPANSLHNGQKLAAYVKSSGSGHADDGRDSFSASWSRWSTSPRRAGGAAGGTTDRRRPDGVRARRLGRAAPALPGRARHVARHRRSSRCSWPSRSAGCTASPGGRWKRASCSTSPSASPAATSPTSTSCTSTARARCTP